MTRRSMHDPCFQRVYSLEYLASAVFLALLVNSLERLPEANSFVRPRLLEVFLDLLFFQRPYVTRTPASARAYHRARGRS